MKIRIKVSIDATRRLSMNAFRWQRVCVCWWNVCEERERERERKRTCTWVREIEKPNENALALC